jgi:FkbM family methyltransferase
MKKILHSALVKITNSIYGNAIKGKLLNPTPYILYYERAKHLNFLFGKNIKYELDIQNKLSKYIKEGSLIFDIGANIGQYSLYFSQLTGVKGKVVSFEPDSKNLAFLNFNLSVNGIVNVETKHCGVGNTTDILDFYKDSVTGGRMGSFIVSSVSNRFKGDVEKVEMVTLSMLVDFYGFPNFIKIDVEGFEEAVILGLPENIPDDCTFLIEVREKSKDFVFNFFTTKGFDCFCIETNLSKVLESEDIPNFANLIIQKRNF